MAGDRTRTDGGAWARERRRRDVRWGSRGPGAIALDFSGTPTKFCGGCGGDGGEGIGTRSCGLGEGAGAGLHGWADEGAVALRGSRERYATRGGRAGKDVVEIEREAVVFDIVTRILFV